MCGMEAERCTRVGHKGGGPALKGSYIGGLPFIVRAGGAVAWDTVGLKMCAVMLAVLLLLLVLLRSTVLDVTVTPSQTACSPCSAGIEWLPVLLLQVAAVAVQAAPAAKAQPTASPSGIT